MKKKTLLATFTLLVLSAPVMATGSKTVDPAWFMSFFSLF